MALPQPPWGPWGPPLVPTVASCQRDPPARTPSYGLGAARLGFGWLLGFVLISAGFRLDFGFGLIRLDSGLV